MSDIFGDDFDLNDIKETIIGYGIDPQEAKNVLLAALKENFSKDKSLVELYCNQNPPISKKMNYYIDDDLWYIKVRKERSGEFLHGDYILINLDFKGKSVNKIVFSIETISNKMAPIGVCPMHSNRLDTKVCNSNIIGFIIRLFQHVIAIKSIPDDESTDWIEKRILELNQKCKIEFVLGRQTKTMEFMIQINCSSSCWRSMIPDVNEVALVTRLFDENKFLHEVVKLSYFIS